MALVSRRRRHKPVREKLELWSTQEFLQGPEWGLVAVSGYVAVTEHNYVDADLAVNDGSRTFMLCKDVDMAERLALALAQYAKALRRAQTLVEQFEKKRAP